MTVCGLVAFAVLAGVLLAKAVGQRHPGQTITGNSQIASNGSGTTTPGGIDLSALAAAATAQPKSYDAADRVRPRAAQRGSGARRHPAVHRRREGRSETAGAAGVHRLAERARGAPDQRRETRATLFGAATDAIDAAIAKDPKYVPAYAFKGVTLSVFEQKPCAGVPALQQYLVLAPADDQLRSLVTTTLAGAVKAGKCPVTSAPATTTPTPKP